MKGCPELKGAQAEQRELKGRIAGDPYRHFIQLNCECDYVRSFVLVYEDTRHLT